MSKFITSPAGFKPGAAPHVNGTPLKPYPNGHANTIPPEAAAAAIIRLAYGRRVLDRTRQSLTGDWLALAEFVTDTAGSPATRYDRVREIFLPNIAPRRPEAAERINAALAVAWDAAQHQPPEDEAEGAEPSANGQPVTIEVAPDRHRVLAEALEVLPADPDLFRRGNALVRVVSEPAEVAKLGSGVTLHNALGSVRVAPVTEAGLSCRLTALAEFYTWRTDRKGEAQSVPVHPPTWLAAAIIGDGHFPGVRPLLGVAEVPFPRPDGSIVTEPGYDPITGHLHAPTITIDSLPDRPTQEDARNAARLLLNTVWQFPFASEDDAAVWLASVLTLLARPGIAGPTPGSAYNANRAGVGKGRLIDIAGIIATGRPVPTSGYPRDDAEAAKSKIALALNATAVVHLDNLDEGLSYGGGALDSALTATVVNDRILGQSKTTGEVPLRCVWFLSGNNISPRKDAHRRWLVCNLETALERPEERDDLETPDILGHVGARRAELVRAALTTLKAHALAGRPTGGWAPLGSFEEWDRIVRGAVWFATGRDCTTTRRKAAEDAPERLDNLALLEAWAEIPNGGPDGNGATATEAHRLATADPDGDLAVALLRFSRDGKIPSPRVIGNRIRAIAGRNYGGLAFHARGFLKRERLWMVVKV